MNGQKSNKFLLTQSLLSSWQYALKGGDWDEFLSTLRREKKPQSKAMLDGIRFENMVHAVSEGAEIDLLVNLGLRINKLWVVHLVIYYPAGYVVDSLPVGDTEILSASRPKLEDIVGGNHSRILSHLEEHVHGFMEPDLIARLSSSFDASKHGVNFGHWWPPVQSRGTTPT